MVQKLTLEQLNEHAIIHEAPTYIRNAPLDRSFELPTVLYAATAGLFMAFMAILVFGFAHPQLIVPGAIFALFIAAFFAVPAVWVRMQPENPVKAKSWSRFVKEGIQTYTGHVDAGGAAVQVLTLPVLVTIWAISVVSIAAVVA